MITTDDIGHEVAGPNAHWDMRGERDSLDRKIKELEAEAP